MIKIMFVRKLGSNTLLSKELAGCSIIFSATNEQMIIFTEASFNQTWGSKYCRDDYDGVLLENDDKDF